VVLVAVADAQGAPSLEIRDVFEIFLDELEGLPGELSRLVLPERVAHHHRELRLVAALERRV
jgi:lipase chaperone LimK